MLNEKSNINDKQVLKSRLVYAFLFLYVYINTRLLSSMDLIVKKYFLGAAVPVTDYCDL